MKKALNIKILCILITGFILTVAINLAASAQQQTINVITEIYLGLNTIRGNHPITAANFNLQNEVERINCTEYYTLTISTKVSTTTMWGEPRDLVLGEVFLTGTANAQITDITITAKEGNKFCEDVAIRQNGALLIHNGREVSILSITEEEIKLLRRQNVNNNAANITIPPRSPTYHTVTIGEPDNNIDPTPTPQPTDPPPTPYPTDPPPTPDPPELPDLSEFSEVIIYAAELVIHEKRIQTAEIKKAISEQTEQLIQAIQQDSQNEDQINAIEDQTNELNKTMQHNLNMIIIFSLVTIGSIIGIGFLVAWRPTYD
jgi:hypothetical protein